MAFMAPILADNRPFLLTGYWSHQVLNKDAAQRWRTFAGIKSVVVAHGLEQLRECCDAWLPPVCCGGSSVYRSRRLECDSGQLVSDAAQGVCFSSGFQNLPYLSSST